MQYNRRLAGVYAHVLDLMGGGATEPNEFDTPALHDLPMATWSCGNTRDKVPDLLGPRVQYSNCKEILSFKNFSGR